MGKPVDITGQRYGRLVALYCFGKDKFGRTTWMCRCDCGNEKVTSANELRRGSTRSCGCWEEENRKAIATRSRRTHQMKGTRLYRVWQGMKNRCVNERDAHWKDYGGRGITVCDEWKSSFENFRDWALTHGYADDLTIDRIDFNAGYSPDNCRFVPPADQQRNKRNNKYYTYQGRTQLIPAWAKEFGVTDSTIRSRIRRGAKPEEVFSELQHQAARI